MKRFILWLAGILAVLVVAALLAFGLSPWPSVAVIDYAFSKGDQAANAALAKHTPDGIVSRLDIAYGRSGDEVFDVYYKVGASAAPAVVWVHGGGFVAGSKSELANYMKILAGHGYTTIAVEYSRGYNSRYPRPVEQINAALGFVIRHAADLKVDPTMIVLAGDSAGAHIGSQVALITTNSAYARELNIAPQLKAQQLSAMLLLSGVYDPSQVHHAGGYGWFLKTMLWAYSGVRNFNDDERFKLMSIPAHVTAAFPASFISSGNADLFEPQAVALARRLSGLGVHVETLFFPDRSPPLPHEYQFNLDDPAGRQALSRLLAFLAGIRDRVTSQPAPTLSP
jgi:acetyl esterase